MNDVTKVLAQLMAQTLPPDAGNTTLGAFGLQNPIVSWIMTKNPEILAMSPRQLTRGLKAPTCPRPYCWYPMVLRVIDAEGRQPRRLVWRCFKHGGGDVPTREIAPPVMDRPKVSMQEMIAATKRGAILDYQPDPWGQQRLTIIEKPRKRRR